MLYHAYQAQAYALAPGRMLARTIGALGRPDYPIPPAAAGNPFAMAMRAWGDNGWFGQWTALCEAFDRTRITHERPAFGIASVASNGREYAVIEEASHRTPFATLLHFRKDGAPEQPRVLLVAPLSGHFSTLLRETVRTLLIDHDVWITDWHNARDVPIEEGRFGLDEYIDHMIAFLRLLGPNAHLIAICQPCVAALASVAVLAQDADPAQPATMTLMAGPIDCRVNPTAVNRLATERPIEWFERNLISRVPLPHRGAARRVYPGVTQLAAFMNMNLPRHIRTFGDMVGHRIAGEHEAADAIARFYEEYFAVNDLTAEFYLETVERVFQTYDLPLGKLGYRGDLIDPSAIQRTALMTVEGERDDICSIGQTVAAQDLCTRIRPYQRTHHVQTGVGHYGVFSGRKWSGSIYPRVRDMIHVNTR
ncbi:MAG: polyhydroxyalkanoate depolymerase [Burkholderiaceae bacterium]